MKFLSLAISILVAVLSAVLFREHLVELAATGLATLSSYCRRLAPTTTATSPPAPSPDPHANMTVPRAIQKVFLATEQSEGAGAKVRRSIGTPQLRSFSPFLMLDHFSIKPGAGFPDHPHRGQETITYLLEGAVDHEDFAGNAGTIEAGDLQFMTAGRGIVHAEMPRQNADGGSTLR